jgi:hypothetical protein
MKHVGKIKNNSARVVVAYRTLPNEPYQALVVGTQGLNDAYHDSLMSMVESDSAQQAEELADVLAVRKFPDGTNMLGYLHNNGHLKKVPTNTVLMTPNSQSSILLSDLNQLIAKQKGVLLEDLAVREEGNITKPQPRKKKEEVVEETSEMTAARLRSEADGLYKRAKELRAQAEALVPTIKKSKKELVEE